MLFLNYLSLIDDILNIRAKQTLTNFMPPIYFKVFQCSATFSPVKSENRRF